MVEQDTLIIRADVLCCLYEHAVLGCQGVASYQTRKFRNVEHRYRNDNIGHAAAKDRYDRDGQNDTREREQRVTDTHDNGINDAAVVTADQAQERADHSRDADREQADT